MNRLLKASLARVVISGNLVVIDADGQQHRFGDGNGVRVAIRLHDRQTERGLVINPELAAGEAYMDGRLTMPEGEIYDFLSLVMRNMSDHPLPRWSRSIEFVRRLTRRLAQFNPRVRARRNVAHHYDVDPRIFSLFLDKDWQYSCAYFPPGSTNNTSPRGRDPLDIAQKAKQRHIAAKLALREGQTVLDIGSGWGGLAAYFAECAAARVHGVTLSRRQLASARSRAIARGLDDKVTFALEDYRDTEGRYDRIVSVGMLEHVGAGSYPAYFKQIARLLADDGVALIHTIGRSDDAGGITNPFIAKYIFPGGYLPALSELTAAIEVSGLVVADIEVLRLHYAETLRLWRKRFLAHREQAVAISGETFARMWEFYLAGSEAAFRYQNLVVFQIQLAKKLDAVAITRDYIAAEEQRLGRREGGSGLTLAAGE